MATMPAPATILVIGGGLGGLAFAQILRHSAVGDRYKVLIFERDASPTHRGQGYQIGLNRAGAAHLAGIPSVSAALDVAKRRKANAFSIVDGELRDMLHLRQADDVAAIVNRWRLRSALADGLEVHWGKKLVRYDERATQVVAHFEDGTEVQGDLLVGADGVRSRVRAQRCPGIQLEEVPIVNTAGSIVVTHAAPRVVDLARNSHLVRALARGGNTVMLMDYDAPDGETRLLWSYSFPSVQETSLPTDPVELKQVIDARARAVFGGELATVIRDTVAEEYVFEAPRRLVAVVPVDGENPLGATTRVTLLGDAAHAMTTHRGLGANTAFADAADLARALARVEDVWGALREYEAVMVRRGFEAVRASSQSTHMIHLAGVRGVVRDVVIRVVGWILWAKQLLLG